MIWLAIDCSICSHGHICKLTMHSHPPTWPRAPSLDTRHHWDSPIQLCTTQKARLLKWAADKWAFPLWKIIFPQLRSFHWLGSPESCTSQLVSTGNANAFSHTLVMNLKSPTVAAQKSKGKCYPQSHILGQAGINPIFLVSPFWTVHCTLHFHYPHKLLA